MKIYGFASMVVGLALMAFAGAYDPYDRYSEAQQIIQSVPASVYNPGKAQNRLILFGAGGLLLLAGSIFAAAGVVATTLNRADRRPD